jgi:RND family efflux transporter MFP subunit
LDQAKSMYEQAREQFENSFIKAPFDGVVAAVYVDKNQTINIGQQVVQVISPSKMKAKVYLTGGDIQNVKAGQRVLIKFPTIPDKEYAGKVSRINTAIDKMSKSLEVEIAFLSRDKNIKSGIFGEYFIEIQNNSNSLVIPEPALISQSEIKIDRATGLQNTVKKYYLFMVENNTARLKEVKTGIANDGQIEIVDGLHLGDSVIIVGQNIVKEGQTVNIIE